MNNPHGRSEGWIHLVKVAVVRLFFIIGVWILFFQLYSLTGLEEPSFKPLILFMIGIYVILEIATMILTVYIYKKDPPKDELTKRIFKLAKTIKEAQK